MDKLCDATSVIAYILGGGLIIGDWLSLLDAHAGGFGVLIAGATFASNLFFQHMRLKKISKVKKVKNE